MSAGTDENLPLSHHTPLQREECVSKMPKMCVDDCWHDACAVRCVCAPVSDAALARHSTSFFWPSTKIAQASTDCRSDCMSKRFGNLCVRHRRKSEQESENKSKRHISPGSDLCIFLNGRLSSNTFAFGASSKNKSNVRKVLNHSF